MQKNKIASGLTGTWLPIILSLILLYVFLGWVNNSWYTGASVLSFLSPLIESASTLGDRASQVLLLQSPVLIILLTATFILLADLFIRKHFAMILPTLFFSAAFASPLLLLANKTSLYYLLCGTIIICLLVLWMLPGCMPDPNVQESGPKRSSLIVFILGVALLFRFYMLDSLPPGITDEMAGIALFMEPYITGTRNVFMEHFWQKTPISILGNGTCILAVLFSKLYGFTPYVFRILSAASGFLSIWVLYLLSKRLFGVRVALFASFLMAVSPWHVFFSRMNYSHNSTAVLHSILTYYVLFLAFEKKGLARAGLLGFFMGASVYFYETGKITLAGAGLTMILLYLHSIFAPAARKKYRLSIPQFLVCSVVLGITLFPYIRWGLQDVSYLYSASGSSNLTKAFWTEEGEDLGGASHVTNNLKYLLPVLAESRVSSPNSQTSNLYAHSSKGVIDPLIISAIIIGIALTLRFIKKWPYQVLLLWGITAIIPALLTSVLPKRLTILIPPLYILAGLGFNVIYATFIPQEKTPLWKTVFSRVVIGGFFLVILCLHLNDYFKETSYASIYHSDYFKHRKMLTNAASNSKLYTDFDNSILGLSLAGGSYNFRSDLKNRFLTILDQEKNSGHDLSFLVKPSAEKGKAFLASLQHLFPVADQIVANDFILYSFKREQLAGIFGFASGEPVQTVGQEKRYQYTATLFVPITGNYHYSSSLSGIERLEIDEKSIPPTLLAQGSISEVFLIEGTHWLSLISADPGPPVLNWSLESAYGKQDAGGVIFQPSLYEVQALRSHPSQRTGLTLTMEQQLPLSSQIKISRPVDLFVDKNGLLYVTDATQKCILVFGSDGSLQNRLSPGSGTLRMAVPYDNEGILVLKPYSSIGLTLFDLFGDKIREYPFTGKEFQVNASGNIILMRSNGLYLYAPPKPGGVLKTKSRFLLDGMESGPIALAPGQDHSLNLLAGDANIYKLSPDLDLISTIAVNPRVVDAKTRFAVDRAGRFFLTDPSNNRISVFDKEGNLLIGNNPKNNCPLPVPNPIDVAFHNSRLYVLHKDTNKGYNISVFSTQESGN